MWRIQEIDPNFSFPSDIEPRKVILRTDRNAVAKGAQNVYFPDDPSQ